MRQYFTAVSPSSLIVTYIKCLFLDDFIDLDLSFIWVTQSTASYFKRDTQTKK